MSIRQDVADMLQDAWADIPELAEVRVLATQRGIDELSKPTALITSRTLGRVPEAPNSDYFRTGLMLTLISPHADLDRAQDQLDEIAEAALKFLQTFCVHEDATTVGWGDSRLAFDIPITIFAAPSEE
jgi:hypothetical protein